MDPVIICAAPILRQGPPEPPVPYDVADMVEDIHTCAIAGASMVHLHVVDAKGHQSPDSTLYTQTLDGIRAAGDELIIQSSTGDGWRYPLQDRCPALDDPRTEVALLNMGTYNVGDDVFVNTLPQIRYFASRIQGAGALPELRCSDVGHVLAAEQLASEGLISGKRFYSYALGMLGGMPATPGSIWSLRRYTPEGHAWGVSQHGVRDFSLLYFALGAGAGCIRLGLENSKAMREEKPWMQNVDIIDAAVRMVHAVGREVATPEQARNILGIG